MMADALIRAGLATNPNPQNTTIQQQVDACWAVRGEERKEEARNFRAYWREVAVPGERDRDFKQYNVDRENGRPLRRKPVGA